MEIKGLKIIVILALVLNFEHAHAGDYYKSDRILFDFYTSQWVNKPAVISTELSLSFTCSWGRDIQYKKTNFSWFYGLGYDFTKINHNANLKPRSTFQESPREVGLRVIRVPYKINRLTSQYIECPIELRYRTQTKQPFRFYVGGKVGLMTNARYQLQNGENYQRNNISELQKFKYGMTLRVGYGLFNVFAYYGLNGLIHPENQRGVNQLSFGISLIAN